MSERKESLAPRLDKDARRQKMALPPQPVLERSAAERLGDFAETAIPFTPDQAIAEASRCLLCPGAPCAARCLMGNDIPGAMWLISQGDFLGAATLYRQTSAIPEVCGRICPQEELCEGACVLAKHGTPVALGHLEVFVTDYERAHSGHVAANGPATGRRVAVIGSGPAGIAAADWLRRAGHAVTIYEALPEPGGLLIYGVPTFKLDKGIVRDIFARLQARGISLICNTRVGRDVPFEAIYQQYDAVFIGSGASVDATARIPGSTLPGVLQAMPFLIRANLPPALWPADLPPEPPPVGRHITVFGGGDTAMDCVRSALRLQQRAGYDPLDVTCVYRRTEEEMPGNRHDRHLAREEGGQFLFLAAPVRFLSGDDGRLAAVECIRMRLGEPDDSGRRRPIPIDGSEFTLETDLAVLALGFGPDPLLGEVVPGLQTRDGGLITIDPETGRTSLPGVYAGGDNVTGPNLAGRAAAAGIRAAKAIDAYLARRNRNSARMNMR